MSPRGGGGEARWEDAVGRRRAAAASGGADIRRRGRGEPCPGAEGRGSPPLRPYHTAASLSSGLGCARAPL